MKKREAIWSLILIPLCLMIWSCGDDKEYNETNYYGDEVITDYLYDPDSPALTQYFDTVRENALGLDDHTIYRPKDIQKFAPNSIPVVLWANGGCRNTNIGHIFISTAMSKHGFIVIANGAPENMVVNETSNRGPEKQLDALDWLESEEGQAQLRGKADLSKIATAGVSCGGMEAMLAGADPRVGTVIADSSGFFPPDEDGNCALGYCPDNLYNLHSPLLIIDGGETDVAYTNARLNFEMVAEENSIPVYLAEHTHAGHGGLGFGVYDGAASTAMLNQAEWLYVNWLDFVLNGNQTAKAYIFNTGESQLDLWNTYFPIWDETNTDSDDGLPIWNYFYSGWDGSSDKLIE